jgi:3-deoxy-D-manno-octulosonic-acid transferase
LIVDTIGELEALYDLASLVFVGGSLIPHGGQNMLEPAALGRAVLYGPYVDNFSEEASLLEEAGGARRVADERELTCAFAELGADASARARMAAAGRAVVQAQRGATEKTLQALELRCLASLAGA